MKKLIMAVALVAFAVTAQASKVTWGAAAAIEGISAGTFYLAWATDEFDATAFDNQKSFSAATLAAAGLDNIVDQFDYSSSKTKVTDTFNASDLGYTGTKSCYQVLISSDGKTLAYAGPASVMINNNSSPTQAKSAPIANFSTKTAGGDVPEPTSGLLLLLGVAGLALRRKQA